MFKILVFSIVCGFVGAFLYHAFRCRSTCERIEEYLERIKEKPHG